MEFLSIFIAVISAFALSSWNENRRENEAANKILLEISHGLQKDLEDIKTNIMGHEGGIKACDFWRKVVLDLPVSKDTMIQYYFALTRDFFSAQNNSGYETLKSKGLEILRNDSLRYDIISLYEYDYKSLKTMEEEYFEMQFQENYFKDFNNIIAPNFEFSKQGSIAGIKTPLAIRPNDKKILLTYLWKIRINRQFILSYYATMEDKIQDIRSRIDVEIGE